MENPLLKFAQSSATYGLGSMLQRFASLLLLPVFTSHLTTEEYGVFSLLIILGALALPIFSLGMSAALGPSYFKAKTQKNKDTVIWTALTITAISAIILITTAWLIPSSLLSIVMLDEQYSLLTSIFLTAVAANIITSPLTLRIQFEKQAKLYVVIALLTTLVTITFNIVTVALLNWGIFGIATSQLIGNSTSAILLFGAARLKTPYAFSPTTTRNLLKIGIPLIPSFGFLFIMANSGKYALQSFFGESAVGTYTVGFQLGTALNLFVGAFATAWYPFFMEYINKQEQAAKVFSKITTLYVLFFGFICLLFFNFAEITIYFVTAPTFHEAHAIIGLISLAYLFSGMFNLFLPPIYFADKVQYLSLVQAFAACLSIVVAVVASPIFGLPGAALSMTAGYAIMAFGILILNVVHKHISLKISYEWPPILKFSFIGLFIACLSFYPTTPLSIAFAIKPLLLTIVSALSLWICLPDSHRRYLFSSIKSHKLPNE